MRFENRRPLWRQEEHKGKELLLVHALLMWSFLEAQSRRDTVSPPRSQCQAIAPVNQRLGQWPTVSDCGGVNLALQSLVPNWGMSSASWVRLLEEVTLAWGRKILS